MGVLVQRGRHKLEAKHEGKKNGQALRQAHACTHTYRRMDSHPESLHVVKGSTVLRISSYQRRPKQAVLPHDLPSLKVMQ